jgi:hypothetical protein
MVNTVILNRVLMGIGEAGGHGNVMEILRYDQSAFEEGFAIANSIQNMDLVKLLYSNYNLNKIIVEFTLLGKARYEALK